MKILAKACRGCITVLRDGEFVEEYRFDNGAVMRRVVRPRHIVPLTHVPLPDLAAIEAARMYRELYKDKMRRAM